MGRDFNDDPFREMAEHIEKMTEHIDIMGTFEKDTANRKYIISLSDDNLTHLSYDTICNHINVLSQDHAGMVRAYKPPGNDETLGRLIAIRNAHPEDKQRKKEELRRKKEELAREQEEARQWQEEAARRQKEREEKEAAEKRARRWRPIAILLCVISAISTFLVYDSAGLLNMIFFIPLVGLLLLPSESGCWRVGFAALSFGVCVLLLTMWGYADGDVFFIVSLGCYSASAILGTMFPRV